MDYLANGQEQRIEFIFNIVLKTMRGKVLSIIMMDRGMIPLGSLVMSFFADVFGILTTFMIMGITTVAISVIFYLIQRMTKLEESNNEA